MPSPTNVYNVIGRRDHGAADLIVKAVTTIACLRASSPLLSRDIEATFRGPRKDRTTPPARRDLGPRIDWTSRRNWRTHLAFSGDGDGDSRAGIIR
jgi:hypothetical protein